MSIKNSIPLITACIFFPLITLAQTNLNGHPENLSSPIPLTNKISPDKKSTISIPGIRVIPGKLMDTTKLFGQPSITDSYEEIFYIEADPITQMANTARFYYSQENNQRYDSAIFIDSDPPNGRRSMYSLSDNIYPWISGDGKRLYWSYNAGGGTRIVMANRDTNTGKFPWFTDIEYFSSSNNRVVSTWLSTDELTMYVSTQIPVNDSVSHIYVLNRSSISQPFLGSTSQRISLTGINLTGFFAAPSLTPDEQELFIWSFGNADSSTFLRFKRTGPYTFDFRRQYNVYLPYLLQPGQLSKDGLRLYFSVIDTSSSLANIYYTERPNQSSDFVLTAKEFMPQVSTSAINVFPVPASNTIHIESRTKEAYIENFGLTNSFGQLVLEKKFINSLITYSLDVSSLPSGAYVYEIKTSTGIATGRVLISK